MRILFMHQVVPGQFGHLALEFTRRFGWECHFLTRDMGDCPSPSPEMLNHLRVERFQPPPRPAGIIPWQEAFAVTLETARALYDRARDLPLQDFDLVVAHPLLSPTLFLPEVVRCPIIHYCEYYHAVRNQDMTYRVDLPLAPLSPFYPRCINAPILTEILTCAGGYAPTQWQKESFPRRFWPKIEVHFDGIDTVTFRPRETSRERLVSLLGGRSFPAGTRLITFVARGLESTRGFDLFMQVAKRVAAVRSDVLFVVVGADKSYYAWDRQHTGSWSFKDWVLRQGSYDLSRFVFLDRLGSEDLAELLARSDLHLYLTVPFVLSWSLFNAMASGCTVLAGDVAPVREVIHHGQTGFVGPLLDTERLADLALDILADPAQYRPLGAAARALMEERYSIECAVPELKDYFERMAVGRNRELGN
jgi:glycosyltransferase involved in cell wall biosynthesis